MGQAETKENVEALSFENALSELETIVKDLETGKAPLENAIASYARGVELKKHCEKKLREAQEKIEKITINEDGDVSTTPFEPQE